MTNEEVAPKIVKLIEVTTAFLEALTVALEKKQPEKPDESFTRIGVR